MTLHVSIVGIGTGNPKHLTQEAIDAIRATDAFVVTSKNDGDELEAFRKTILADFARADAQIITVEDPKRDRTDDNYESKVDDWHAARARAWAAALPTSGRAAVLTWGDPAFYDSTIRVVERIGCAFDVVPGISAINVLAAHHKIVFNRVGGAIHITNSRGLAAALDAGMTDIVVMLDGGCAFQHHLDVPADIYWGAYLGMDNELLISGPLADVSDEIVRARAEARAQHGWIMDTYLIRRPLPPA